MSIYSMNNQMLTEFPKTSKNSWEYYVNMMIIFVSKIFNETPADMMSTFVLHKNILYMIRKCSEEEKMTQDVPKLEGPSSLEKTESERGDDYKADIDPEDEASKPDVMVERMVKLIEEIRKSRPNINPLLVLLDKKTQEEWLKED
uniref:Uncharacterized protein n=1 Tax=Meloidogyne floridensis TaxID=298350 RepID=A0A915NCM9_9BILA